MSDKIGVMQIDPTTNNVIANYDSLHAAAAAVGATPTHIRRAVRLGTVSRGYYWQRTTITRIKPVEVFAVWQWEKSGKFCAEYSSQQEAASYTGVSKSHICECIHNRKYSAGGYRWTRAGVQLVVEPDPVHLPKAGQRANARPVFAVPAGTTEGHAAESAIWFDSLGSAARELGLDEWNRRCIAKGIGTSKAVRCGYLWIDGSTDDIEQEYSRAAALCSKARRKAR